MSLGLLGKKLGMTHVYDENGKATAVTVVDVSENEIIQVKTTENDGYSAVQVGTGNKKASRVNKAATGHFAKYGVEPKYRVREFRVEGEAPAAGTKLRECEEELANLDRRRRESESRLLNAPERLQVGMINLRCSDLSYRWVK